MNEKDERCRNKQKTIDLEFQTIKRLGNFRAKCQTILTEPCKAFSAHCTHTETQTHKRQKSQSDKNWCQIPFTRNKEQP